MHDQGVFETVYGGARAMMGPHNGDLTLDQFMQVIAWVRHLYKDPVNQAFWLTDAQKKNYKPYTLAEGKRIAALRFRAPASARRRQCKKRKNKTKKTKNRSEPFRPRVASIVFVLA